MKITINRSKPAIIKVQEVVVAPAVPSTVTCTIPLADALVLAALGGKFTGTVLNANPLWSGLRDHPLFAEASALVADAVAYEGVGADGTAYQKNNVSFHAFDDRAKAFKAKAEAA